MSVNKRTVGSKEEDEAARFLTQCGLKIVELNFRSRVGEIDIVARDGDILVFAEVKYRKTASNGHPEEAVDYKKSRTICKVSDYYRYLHNIPSDVQIRFDVIAIENTQFHWYKNAFPYMGM